ncbi:MAG: hypothetical protein CBC22_00265 [Alphaproteobacteria bacterium TMED62]|nr:MAG: hypothetical protein CBC22_00265 [Alphaproteobacteria bacterium TMED62]|tara:strand:+ start:3757 stop:4410 length:654 start_codon:yes stop_codon:yes gene_type:complete
MLKVYGLSLSNHSSMIKFALKEKKIDYEWIETLPYSMSNDKSILEKSAIGALPIIEYQGEYISETLAIFSFLDKAFPNIKLFSEDPLEFAKTIEIINICQFYIELQARNFYPFIFFGGKKPEGNIDMIKDKIHMGLKSLEKKSTLNPYMINNFSYADIYSSFAIFTTIPVCKQIYDWDILQDFIKLSDSLDIINSRDTAKAVYNDVAEAMNKLNNNT